MTLKTYISILFVFIVAAWLWIGYKKSQRENDILERKEMKGTIIKMFKKEGNKNYTLVFRDNIEFDLPYFAPTDKIKPGDSLYKAPNSFDYIFFNKGNPFDTIIFRGKINGKILP